MEYHEFPKGLKIPHKRRFRRIKARAQGVVPLRVDRRGVWEHHPGPIHLTKSAYLWEIGGWDVCPEPVVVAQIWTLHSFGYHMFFKPTIGDVVSQVPGKLLGSFDSFTTRGPRNASELNLTYEYVEQGYHLSLTTLYNRRLYRTRIRTHADPLYGINTLPTGLISIS